MTTWEVRGGRAQKKKKRTDLLPLALQLVVELGVGRADAHKGAVHNNRVVHEVEDDGDAHEAVVAAELLALQAQQGARADGVGREDGEGQRDAEDCGGELLGLEHVCQVFGG